MVPTPRPNQQASQARDARPGLLSVLGRLWLRLAPLLCSGSGLLVLAVSSLEELPRPWTARLLVAVGLGLTFAPVIIARLSKRLEGRRLVLALSRPDSTVLITDLRGRIEWTAQGRRRLFRHPPGEEGGRDLIALLLAQGLNPRDAVLLRENLEKGRGFTAEMQSRPESGLSSWISLEVQPLRDQRGKVSRAIAIQRDITERKRAEQRRLLQYAVTRALAESTTLDETVPRILEEVCRSLEWDWGALWVVDRKEEVLRWGGSWHSPFLEPAPLEENIRRLTFARRSGLAGRVWSCAEPLWVSRLGEELDPWRGPAAQEAGLQGALAFPVLSGGEVYGVLEFFHREVWPPDPDLLKLAASLGSQIGQFIDRKRSEEAVLEQARLAEFVADVGLALTRGGDLQDVLRRCTEVLVQQLDAAFARIWVLDKEENVLRLLASAGLYTHTSGPHGRIPLGKSKIGLIAKERKPYLTNQVVGDHQVDQEWALREGMVSFAGYPLVVEDGLLGVVAVFARKPLSEAALQAMGSVANAIALGIETKRAEMALLETNQTLLALVQSSPLGIYTIDVEGKVRMWNPAAERLFGWTAQEIQGRTLPIVPDGYQEEFPSLFEKEMHGATVAGRETLRKRRDGSLVDISLSTAALYDSRNELIGCMGIMEDISRRKRAERDRTVMELKLQEAQKLEAIGRLAAGIAHEINTPIQYMGDNTRFLKDSFATLEELLGQYGRLVAAAERGPLPAGLTAEVEAACAEAELDYLRREIPRALDQSLEGIERVCRIVRAMKDFSHPGTEEKTPLDLNRAIESAITVARNEWKYVADLVTDFDRELPAVPCLPGEFNQVILNLVVNAAQAIGEAASAQDEGGAAPPKGTITVSTRRSGDWAEVRVADTGTGISDSVRAKIFTPFFTTKEVGKGTGQGLCIARSVVVDRHGGTIDFVSEVGRGTTFIIRLPLESRRLEAVAG